MEDFFTALVIIYSLGALATAIAFYYYAPTKEDGYPEWIALIVIPGASLMWPVLVPRFIREFRKE